MTKVDELVEWVAERILQHDFPNSRLEILRPEEKVWRINFAKQILSHPDLALIDREKEKPRIHYGSYLSIKGGDERIIGWELHERRMKEEGFTYSIIPLAEALKEVSNAPRRRG